jgi:uncharacterized membrane-anchored protein
VAAAQWYVTVSLVTKSEQTLVVGKEFHFKTVPVDPSDPFRGKYITLRFEASNIVVHDTIGHLYESGEVVFAAVSIDSTGFAVVDSLYSERPNDESLTIIKARVRYAYREFEGTGQSVDLEFPFERLYLEESMASDAERVYWENRRAFNDSTSTTTTYAVVRIRDEHAVLVDVKINDRSIVDIVKEINEEEVVAPDTLRGNL